MRAVVVLACLLMVPMVGAGPLPLTVLDPIIMPDPAGDVEGDPVDAGAPGYIDIVEAVLDLDEERLRFQVTMADVSLLTNVHSQRSDKPVWAEFNAMGERFLVVLLLEARPLVVNGDNVLDHDARLYRFDGELWHLQDTFVPDHQYEAGIFATDVPLDAIRDGDGFPLAPGAVVTLMAVEARETDAEIIYDPNQDPSQSGGLNPLFPSYRDRVDVPSDAILAVPEQLEGLLQVVTELPLRYSNGGGSFHWPVQVHNPLPEAMVVEAEITAPDGVATRVPDAFVLEAGATRTVDVLASLPNAHQHGGSVPLEAHFSAGGETTILPLTIHYLDIAQPAGHHDTLWLHGRAGEAINGNGATNPGAAFMNTLRDDPDDTATSLRSASQSCADAQIGQLWWVPLEPRLLIGLDARTDETARFEATVSVGNLPMAAHSLHAKLLLVDDLVSPFRHVAALEDADEAFHGRIEVPLQGQVDIELDLPVPVAMDRVEASADMPNLGLGILACPEAAGTGSGSFYLQPGASLRLPLDEYQEVLDIEPGSVGLTVDEPVIRAAAGVSVVWDVHVAPSEGRYQLSLFGPAADHATLHGPHVVDAAGVVAVSMQVPEAAAGDLLQFVVIVENLDDPADASSLALAVLVDPSSDRDDTAAVAALAEGPAKESPGLPLLLLIAALAFAVRRQ